MSAGKAIYGRLSTAAEVNDAVGGRISPLRSAQGEAYPRITYDVEDTERQKTYAGSDGLVKRTVSIAVESLSYAEAEAIAEKVKDAIDDGEGTWGGVEVLGAFHEGESEDEDTDEENNVTIYTREQEYLLWTREV